MIRHNITKNLEELRQALAKSQAEEMAAPPREYMAAEARRHKRAALLKEFWALMKVEEAEFSALGSDRWVADGGCYAGI